MDDIKIRRLGLAGHITKMEDERIPKKKGLNGKFHNTKTSVEDAVWRDTSEILGIQRWRR